MKISLISITLLAICAYFLLSQSESPDLASTKNTPIETAQTSTVVEPVSAPLPPAESQPDVKLDTLSDLELFLDGEYAGGILYEGELYDYLMGLWDQASPEMTENNYQLAFSEIESNGNTGYLIHVSPEYTETDQQNFEYSAKHTDIERLVSSTEFGQRSMDKERELRRLVSEYEPDDITIVNMGCMEKRCSVYIDAKSDKAFSDFADYASEHMGAAITSMHGKKLNEGLLWLRF